MVTQLLIPRADGNGRVGCREIMVATPAINNLIREGKTHMLYQAIDTGAKNGMISMDKALADLVKQGLITAEEALTRAHSLESLKSLIGYTGSASRAQLMG